MIGCTLLIGNTGVQNASAYGLNTVTLDIFDDLLNVTGKVFTAIPCFSMSVSTLVIGAITPTTQDIIENQREVCKFVEDT